MEIRNIHVELPHTTTDYSPMNTENAQPENNRLNKLIHDNEGKRSSMRMMCLISLATAIALTGFNAAGLTANDFDTNLILYFLGAAIGGKTAQKFAEGMPSQK